MRRTNWKQVGHRVLIVFTVLAVDGIMGALSSPAAMKLHVWLTLPGVTVVRALRGYNPFSINPITWTEVTVNAAIYCTLTAALAVVYQTRRRWRNTFRLLYGVSVVGIVAAWLTPHYIIKPIGAGENSIALMGDGTLAIAYTLKVAGRKDRTGEFTNTVDQPFPGVEHHLSVGPHLRADMDDLLAWSEEQPGKRDLVEEHLWIVQLWVLLLPFLAYPCAAIVFWGLRPRRYLTCPLCAYNLTGHRGPTCPGCRGPNPFALPPCAA